MKGKRKTPLPPPRSGKKKGEEMEHMSGDYPRRTFVVNGDLDPVGYASDESYMNAKKMTDGSVMDGIELEYSKTPI